MTRASLFCHPDDVAASLDMGALRRGGVSRLIVNVLYHDWAVWAPLSRHMPLRRDVGGASAVPVGPDHPLALRPDRRNTELAAVSAAARDAGLAIDAWTVSLHRDDLERCVGPVTSPLVPIDAFGARLMSWVCPSSEEAASYLSAHARDIAAVGAFERVIVEGCHYPLLQHGGAHERDLSRLDEAVRRLLALCFCPACMARLAGSGHDPERWRRDVAAAVFDNAGALRDDPRMQDTLMLRRRRILELFAVMQAAAPSLAFVCADQPVVAGAVFRTGLPSGQDPQEIYATVGLDPAALAEAGIGIVCLAYFRSLADAANHISMYLDGGVPAERLTVALRPGHPDCGSSADLADKLRLVRELGVQDVAFYELTQMDGEDVRRMLAAIGEAA